jgi:hypothetical protein
VRRLSRLESDDESVDEPDGKGIEDKGVRDSEVIETGRQNADVSEVKVVKASRSSADALGGQCQRWVRENGSVRVDKGLPVIPDCIVKYVCLANGSNWCWCLAPVGGCAGRG